MKVIYNFTGSPHGGLTLGTDGSLYGTTQSDGDGWGTVFKITTGGKLTVVYTFNYYTCNGSSPTAAPIQGTDGNFYGTNSSGSWCGGGIYSGTIYKLTPSGSLTTLHTFDYADGINPLALIEGTDGDFYGIASGGGGGGCNTGCGTIFKITPQGTFTLLHAFIGSDGANPYGTLVQADDGNFYGTTAGGGSGGGGVVYMMSPAGKVTVLYNFSSLFADDPFAGLVQATDGKFYGGTTGYYGSELFNITSTGPLNPLVNFTNENGTASGSRPKVAMFQHTNGVLYGNTSVGGPGTNCSGGEGYCGVLFSLDMV
jgi:uncharacterized repeat protein (TIGR03803 family)